MNWKALAAMGMIGIFIRLNSCSMGAVGVAKDVSGTQSRDSVQKSIDPIPIMARFFNQKGFRTGQVELPELKIRIHLEDNQFFKREDGVADVYTRINELRGMFGLSTPYSDTAAGNGWCGVMAAVCGGRKGFAYIVLVKRGLNDASRIYTAAHECGHFLWYVDETSAIYQRSRKPELVKSRIRTNDDFAVMSGWIALKNAGYSLKDCMITHNRNPEKQARIERIRELVDIYFLP